MTFIFHDMLSMVEVPYTGVYWLVDLRSMADIVRELTEKAYIRSTSLNTTEEPIDVLVRTLKLDRTERESDRYSGAGIFNIACHYARAAIATSHLYLEYCARNPALGISPSDMQDPYHVHMRAVYGLAHTFSVSEAVIAQVLGSANDCKTVVGHSWLPDLEWIPRTQAKNSGVVLWQSVWEAMEDVVPENVSASQSAC